MEKKREKSWYEQQRPAYLLHAGWIVQNATNEEIQTLVDSLESVIEHNNFVKWWKKND